MQTLTLSAVRGHAAEEALLHAVCLHRVRPALPQPKLPLLAKLLVGDMQIELGLPHGGVLGVADLGSGSV